MSEAAPRFRLTARQGGVLLGVAISIGLVWQSSQATFSGSTTNPNNSWTTGTVALQDDDSGSAMFTPGNLQPGDTATRCVRVTYTGNVATNVKLYRTAASYSTVNSLASYLDVTISEGANGTFANPTCSDWTAGTQIYSGTLANFAATHTQFSDGLYNSGGVWAPSSNPTAKVYKFVYTLNINAPNGSQAGNAAFGITWEAQST